MKLERAIEVGTQVLTWSSTQLDPAVVASLKLLIEAGKREIECREGKPPVTWCLLPGETKE